MNAPTTTTATQARFPFAVFDIFFRRATPFDLGICRILIFGYAVWRFGSTNYTWESYRGSLYQPVGWYTLFPLPSENVIEVMFVIAKVGAVLCLLGLAYRPAAVATALTLPYLIGIPNCFGKVDHGENLLALAIVVLAFAKAADGLSVDSLIRRRRGRPAPEPSGDYRWPVRTIWLLLCGMYVAAGVAKLIHTGWDWALSDSFQLLLLRHHFTHSPPTEIGIWLANHSTACQVLALGALALELTCVLMMLGGRWTAVFGGSLFALQAGIYLMIGVFFRSLFPIFLTLVPWEQLWLLAKPPITRVLRRT